MIKEHDELVSKISKLCLDGKEEEAKKLSKEKDIILSKMTNAELDELIKRPYPAQYKIKLKSFKRII